MRFLSHVHRRLQPCKHLPASNCLVRSAVLWSKRRLGEKGARLHISIANGEELLLLNSRDSPTRLCSPYSACDTHRIKDMHSARLVDAGCQHRSTHQSSIPAAIHHSARPWNKYVHLRADRHFFDFHDDSGEADISPLASCLQLNIAICIVAQSLVHLCFYRRQELVALDNQPPGSRQRRDGSGSIRTNNAQSSTMECMLTSWRDSHHHIEHIIRIQGRQHHSPDALKC